MVYKTGMTGRVATALVTMPVIALSVIALSAGELRGQPMPGESNVERSARGLDRPMPRHEGLPQSTLDALEAFERALSDYAYEMEDYRTTMLRVLETEYQRQRVDVQTRFDGRIDELREDGRARRRDAVADFRRFLERYPNHPEYTPDVMFRLSQLLYEQSVDDFLVQDMEYDRLVARYERGIDPEMPPEPFRDFTPSILLFRELIERFPNYRQIDGAFYLIGVCYQDMGEDRLALESFERLVVDYPDSDFSQEAWLRIGEHHFERLEFAIARSAYERSLAYGESRLYDKVLFKLGWSTYLLGEYDEAIQRFHELLVYYDRVGDGSEAALKEEALQYFAISITELDWDTSATGVPDSIMGRLDYYMPNVDTSPYTLEVLDRVADVLAGYGRYDEVIEVVRATLARYPLDRENPWRHERIVAAHSQRFDDDEAFIELGVLAEAYARGTDWYNEQERLGNTEAMAYADQLARTALIESANFYYIQAEELATLAAQTGDPLAESEAIGRYETAAILYRQFLDQYPNAEEAYETRLTYAQALFFSLNFQEAGAQYGEVRDSEVSDEFLEDAAIMAVVSYEEALIRAIDEGRLEPRAFPAYDGPMLAFADDIEDDFDDDFDEPNAQRGEPRAAPRDEPIPELALAWAGAIDRLVALRVEPEDEPDLPVQSLFAAGRMYYNYKNYDPARERFVQVLDICRPIDETAFAAAFLIESYAVTNDFDNLRFWSSELERRSACVPEGIREALAQDLDRLAMGQMAERAEALFAEGRYAEAAEEYARLAVDYADNPTTAPLGLFNAGLIYEQQLSRYEQAMQQFEQLVATYPDSEWVDDALVRIAVNARKFFDFDKAIDTYLELDRMGVNEPGLIENPMLRAAELLEYSQRYEEAASTYLAFAQSSPRASAAAASVYKAGTLYELAGNEREMLSAYERFRRDYGTAFDAEGINIDAAYVDTLYRTATYYAERGDTRAADRYFNDVTRAYDDRFPSVQARATAPVRATFAAGEAAYRRAMQEYETWSQIQVTSTANVQRQQQALQQKIDGLTRLVDTFMAVEDLGSADWTICARYMGGRSRMDFVDVIYDLPRPDFGADWELEDAYELALDDITEPIYAAAVDEWRVAYQVMQQLGVRNECTRQLTLVLNQRVGSVEFPLYKESIEHIEDLLFSPQVVARTPRIVEDEDVIGPVRIDIDAEDAP